MHFSLSKRGDKTKSLPKYYHSNCPSCPRRVGIQLDTLEAALSTWYSTYLLSLAGYLLWIKHRRPSAAAALITQYYRPTNRLAVAHTRGPFNLSTERVGKLIRGD